MRQVPVEAERGVGSPRAGERCFDEQPHVHPRNSLCPLEDHKMLLCI